MTLIHCQSCGEPAPVLEVRKQDDGRYFCAVCNSNLVHPQLRALIETCWPAGTRLEEVFTGEPIDPEYACGNCGLPSTECRDCGVPIQDRIKTAPPARERLAPEIPRPIDTPLDFGAAEIARLTAILQANQQRMRDAGERCGIPYADHGCDWPEWVADALIGERKERKEWEARYEAMIHGL